MIHALGVDLTHLAGSVDWTRMRAAGVAFAYVKASDGEANINPRFNQYWRGAYDAGVLRGAYHTISRFPLNPPLDPHEHASCCLQIEADAFRHAPPGELPPAVALEMDGTPPYELLDWLWCFLSQVEMLGGSRPLLRTDYAGWMRLIQAQDGRVPRQLPQDWAYRSSLWVVSHATQTPYVPPPWSSLRWAFWQFSNRGRGARYGLQSQYVNLNLYNGGPDRLKEFSGGREITFCNA